MQISPATTKKEEMTTMDSSQPDIKVGQGVELQETTLAMENELMVKKTVPITLSWENIEVYNPSSKDSLMGKIMFCKKEIPSKQIINGVNGIAKPGTLMAIMGASGAGKTTLLNVLNFRNRGSLNVKGDVKINGQIVKNRAAIATLSGYVQQEDMFIGFLKVKEQLKFQAMLRMGKEFTHQQKMDRIEEVMLETNLKKCENTMIGFPERGVKGISGGERRRLAFACELLTDPNLLFLDEPTSGLDSFMAGSLVECMKRMAAKGKTIICTIHQPSSEVFDMFDTLCLMAEGRLAYLGALKETPGFFQSLSKPVPNNYNPADHYINTLAVVPTRRDECIQFVNKVCDHFQDHSLNSQMLGDMKEANEMPNNEELKIHLATNVQYKVGFFVQFWWLLWRNFFVMIRDPIALHIAVITTLVIGIMLGLIYLQLTYNQSGVQNINGVLFLLLAQASFSNMFAILNSVPAEIPIFLREHQNGMYMVITYYLSKILIDLPKFILLPFIQTTIIYWMSNLNNSAGVYWICVLIVILVANTSVAFGTLLSAVAPNSEAALSLSSPILVPLMIFSGYFLNASNVPKYFIWLQYISWFSYSNELLVINQWQSIDSISCSGSTNCFYKTGNDVIDYLQFHKSNWEIDFIALCIILVGWRVITFFILMARTFKR